LVLWSLAGHLWSSIGGVALATPGFGEVMFAGVCLLFAFAVGEAKRAGSAHFAEMARGRAERERARQERERAREERQMRQATQERLRIAQELHDVIGHHLSLISVQAGVGLHLMDSQPEQARVALSAIRQASTEALREVRAVLAALHSDDDAAPLAPAAGVASLDALAAEVSAAGLPVETETVGVPRALPAEVDRAAYRIVREALTNVRRHAGTAARATVSVEYGDDDVAVRVLDDGSATTSTMDVHNGGTGIVGMRQRASALGGHFQAGPRDDGGFEVYVRLPAPPEVSP
jgi:signal transduction histidine kinase